MVYRVLWVLVLGGAFAKWAEHEFGIPPSIGSLPALALSWWLFGVTVGKCFQRRPKPVVTAPPTMGDAVRKAGAAYLRLMWAIMAVMIAAQAVTEAFSVPTLTAWGGGLALGAWWFLFSERFEESPPAMAFFGPALLPMGIVFAGMIAAAFLS